MQTKTTRAFRTISEAGDELGLQPHVLRFWESKFPQIKPIKRGGGRRFYRPEDIELLRGIKILLHNEKHPIKDVQKLLRVKGPQRVIELGQSVERAAREKAVSETVLIPERIKKSAPPAQPARPVYKPVEAEETSAEVVPFTPQYQEETDFPEPEYRQTEPAGMTQEERADLSDALDRLTALRERWNKFKNPS